MRVRDRLDGLWADEDFAGWYPRDGRPRISPTQLAPVSVLQWPSNRCGGCPGSRGAGVLRIRALGKRSASRRAEASGLLSQSACRLAGSNVRLLSFGRVRVVDRCFDDAEVAGGRAAAAPAGQHDEPGEAGQDGGGR